MTSDVQGLQCPGCGGTEGYVLGDPETATQAFCANDSCHVFMWNPQKTLAELAEDLNVVDLPDWLAP